MPRLYNVASMYVFRTDHLALATSLTSSFPQLPVVLCIGLRSPGRFFIRFGMFTGVPLFTLHLGSHVGET